MQGIERSGQSNYLVIFKLKYRKHLQEKIDCVICLVLSLTGYHNDTLHDYMII